MRKVIVPTAIGGMLEWAEYTFYAYMAYTFAHLFFPASDTRTALIGAFAIFGMGYIMRPLGAIVLSHIGDKYGRRLALTLSMVLMGLATLAIGLLPTYDTIGLLAPILLLLCRLLQGFAVAGELNGVAIFLIEHDQQRRPYLMGSVTGAAASVGVVLGATAAVIVTSPNLPEWSWRIPFFIGSIGCFIGFYLRLHVTETPTFQKIQLQQKIAKLPLWQLIQHYKIPMLKTIVFAAYVSIIFYLGNIYYTTFLIQQQHFSQQLATTITLFGQASGILFYPIFGALADKHGAKPILLTGFAGTAFVGFMLYTAGLTANLPLIVLSQLFYGIFSAAAIAPIFFLLCQLFPVSLRYSGNTIPWCISAAIFGGTAPLLAQFSINHGMNILPAIYMASIALISFIVLVYTPLKKTIDTTHYVTP